MKRIQRGATETIYLTARDEKGNLATADLANLELDALIVQKNDESKYVHIENVEKDLEKGYAYFPLTTEQTSSLRGICNLEVRDRSTGHKIAVKLSAFVFEDNVIHTL